MRDEHGFTMLEIIVILGVIAIMAAVLTPMILNYLDDAKLSRADADVKAISGALLRLNGDVAHLPFYSDGTKTTGDLDIELLRGPGNDPIDNASGPWLTTTKVADLADHLVKNAPGSTKYASTGRFAWRGAYLEKITEDPWGNRYLVNIKNANPVDPAQKVVWVISAGPNGRLETDPNAPADSGPTPGGDDIAVRLK